MKRNLYAKVMIAIIGLILLEASRVNAVDAPAGDQPTIYVDTTATRTTTPLVSPPIIPRVTSVPATFTLYVRVARAPHESNEPPLDADKTVSWQIRLNWNPAYFKIANPDLDIAEGNFLQRNYYSWSDPDGIPQSGDEYWSQGGIYSTWKAQSVDNTVGTALIGATLLGYGMGQTPLPAEYFDTYAGAYAPDKGRQTGLYYDFPYTENLTQTVTQPDGSSVSDGPYNTLVSIRITQFALTPDPDTNPAWGTSFRLSETVLFTYDVKGYSHATWPAYYQGSVTNRPPHIDSYSPLTPTPQVNEGDSLAFTQASSDPDGDELTYSWILDSIIQTTAQSWTYYPDFTAEGSHTVILVVSDGSLTDSIQWNVTVINIAPTTPTTLAVYPPTSEAEIGKTFTVEVKVFNVTNLVGWQFSLTYNNSVLGFVRAGEGPFLNSSGAYNSYFVLKYPGSPNWPYTDTIAAFDVLLAPRLETSVNGTGVLATVTFQVLAAGVSKLALSDTILLRYDPFTPTHIEHTTEDGYFSSIMQGAHDIRVENVEAYPTSVMSGDSVTIAITVENQGDFTETFAVTAYYDNIAIGMKTVYGLAPGSFQTLTFLWDTAGVAEGEYVIKGLADAVPGETDTTDNFFVDGQVKVITDTTPPIAFFTYAPTEPTVNNVVTFDASASTDNIGIVTYEWDFGDKTTASGMVVTHAYTESGTYTARLTVLDAAGNADSTSATITVGKVLSIELSGEFDYMRAEPVRIRLAALVRDAETVEPVSKALVNVEIYDDAGNFWVSASMQEKISGSGIYEWKSEGTIGQLRLSKGVYLVRASASFQGGPLAYDMLLFHIDPPQESEAAPLTPLLYFATAIALIAGTTMGMALLRRRRRRQPL